MSTPKAPIWPWLLVLGSGTLALLLWLYVNRVADVPAPRFSSVAVDEIRIVEDPVHPPLRGATPDSEWAPNRVIAPGAVSAATGSASRSAAIQVLGAGGTPLDGAELFYLSELSVYSKASLAPVVPAPRRAIATTDFEGMANLPVASHPVEVVVFKSGYSPKRFRHHDSQQVVTLSAVGPDGLLIEVVDQRGLPVSGARVLFDIASWGWPVRSGRGQFFDLEMTDARGQVNRKAYSRSGAIGLVSHPDYCLTTFDLAAAGNNRSLIVVLSDAAGVSGQVFGLLSGESVHVAAESANDATQLEFAVRAEASGTFTIPGLSRGAEWIVTPCSMLDERLYPIGESVRVAPPANRVELVAHRSAQLSVRATDGEGVPLAPRVLGSLSPREEWAGAMQEHTVDPRGRWTWTEVRVPQAESTLLWVDADGFLPVEVGRFSFDSGVVDLGEFQLVPAQWGIIEVVDALAGEPIPGASVSFTPLATTRRAASTVQYGRSDVEGLAQIQHSDVGGELAVTKDGWVDSRVLVQAGDLAGTVVVRMLPVARLDIHCVTLEGAPVAGAPIEWRPSAAEESSTWSLEFADIEGIVSLMLAPTEVDVRYSAGALRGELSGGVVNIPVLDVPGNDAFHTKPVRIPPVLHGETRSVVIQLPVADVLDIYVSQDGDPVEGYQVVAIPGDRLDIVHNDIWGVFNLPMATTDGLGRCSLDRLPLGLMTLAAIDPNGGFVTGYAVSIHRSLDLPVDIALRSRTVDVVVEGADGSPLPGVEVQIAQQSAQGGMRIPNLARLTPAGSLRMAPALFRGRRAITNKEGLAQFARVPDTALLTVEPVVRHAYPTMGASLLQPDSGDTRVKLSTQTASALRVAVLSGSVSLDDVELALRSSVDSAVHWARPDQAGEAVFTGVLPGTWSLEVSALDYRNQIELPSGEIIAVTIP